MGTAIYTDYYVELAGKINIYFHTIFIHLFISFFLFPDASSLYTQPLLKTTTKTPSSSTTVLDSTAPAVGQGPDPPRYLKDLICQTLKCIGGKGPLTIVFTFNKSDFCTVYYHVP